MILMCGFLLGWVLLAVVVSITPGMFRAYCQWTHESLRPDEPGTTRFEYGVLAFGTTLVLPVLAWFTPQRYFR
jgi:hypothetical protein